MQVSAVEKLRLGILSRNNTNYIRNTEYPNMKQIVSKTWPVFSPR